jgi:hypothetical protein
MEQQANIENKENICQLHYILYITDGHLWVSIVLGTDIPVKLSNNQGASHIPCNIFQGFPHPPLDIDSDHMVDIHHRSKILLIILDY